LDLFIMVAKDHQTRTRTRPCSLLVNGSPKLTVADLREIDTALSKIRVHGGRMNEEQMKVVDQTA
jgi:hypothetical protein